MEPWVSIFCPSLKCIDKIVDSDGNFKEEKRIYPSVNTELVTQFVCKECGETVTWGKTKRRIVKVIWENTRA